MSSFLVSMLEFEVLGVLVAGSIFPVLPSGNVKQIPQLTPYLKGDTFKQLEFEMLGVLVL